jgi:chromosome segregation ATPase
LKELTKYKLQCQKLDTEINQLKSIKRADEDQLKQLEKMSHSNKEKLEIENENLKNKIFNLDKLINEYEQNFAQFKQKEQSLENRIEYLEKELDRLTNNNTNTNTNSNIDQINSNNSPDHNIKQLDALEQANRILEQELESLKKQQKLERDKVKEKMDILQAKQSEKLKKLEDSNIYYKEQFEKSKKGDNETVEYLRKQCDDLRQRVNELEHVEQHHQETAAAINTSQHVNLERNFLELKKEMQTQSDLLSEERRKFEMERKNFNDLNLEYKKLNETIQNENRKHAQEIESYEQRLNHLQTVLDRKEAEINELKKSKELDASNYLTKLSALNDENLSLVNQLKSISNNTNFKDEELNKQRKKLQDLVNEYDKLRGQLKSCSNLEQDLNEANIKHKHANEKITNLEQKITEWERKYNKELEDFNNFSQQQQQQIKQLKQQLTSETLKHESLNADFSLLKLEASKLESLKSKCDHLESELKETRANKLTRLNDYEQTAHKFHETNEKYENEIKMLNSQINNLVSKHKKKLISSFN